jgi:serine/threonine protein kinase
MGCRMAVKGKKNKTFLCPHCGKRHDKTENRCPETEKEILDYHKLLGNTLNEKYEIERVIGQGGMGVVYQARHLLIERKLAVKVLSQEIATKPEIVKRFYNEARTAANIGHDHIIEITDMGVFGKSPYIVMEYLEGTSLWDYMEDKVLSVEDAVGIVMQVLDALDAVHKKDVVHRDLKPDNIFLIKKPGTTKFVKILDFGISKLKPVESTDPTLTKTGTVLGTPAYMSPEQAGGLKEQDLRIDIYAVGAILYEMLTGHTPFMGDNYNALIAAILTAEPKKPRELNPDIPRPLQDIIMKALVKEPDKRFQDCGTFMKALRPFTPSWSVIPPPDPDLAETSSGSATPSKETLVPHDGSMMLTTSKMGVSTHGLGPAEPTAKKGKRSMLWLGVGIAVAAIAALIIGLTVVTGLKGGVDPASPAVKQKAAEEEFVPSPVTLKFLGLPVGAVVTVDGNEIENNPALVDPSPSRRIIRVEAEGYMPWKAEQVVDANTTIIVDMNKVDQPKEASVPKKGSAGTKTAADKTQPKEAGDGKAAGKKTGSGVYKGKVTLSGHEYPE